MSTVVENIFLIIKGRIPHSFVNSKFSIYLMEKNSILFLAPFNRGYH